MVQDRDTVPNEGRPEFVQYVLCQIVTKAMTLSDKPTSTVSFELSFLKKTE